MAYEFEDVKTSQEIFYYLLEHHALKKEKEPRLYKLYIENESVQNLVKSWENVANCLISNYGNVLYLYPEPQNHFLGYSSAQLAKEVWHSKATTKDYYLIQFVIWVLLAEFYSGKGSSSKTRDYLLVGELQNVIADQLAAGEERQKNNKDSVSDIAFSEMKARYDNLVSVEEGSRSKTTKEGLLRSILMSLQTQDLIVYIEQDEMIKTTQKLDQFVDWNLLNDANYQRVCDALGGSDEQN